MKPSHARLKKIVLIVSGAAIVLGALVYGGYRYWSLSEQNNLLEKSVVSLEQSTKLIKGDFRQLLEEDQKTHAALTAEQQKNGMFADQIQAISGTVGTLKKLSETDKELLQKYSKVYFLSENYVPSRLSDIDSKYLYEKSRAQQFHTEALPFLERMIGAADEAGVKLQIISAYRSFYDQASVKSGYKFTYGAGTANQFSADQGYSEHQLGTAIDFTTLELASNFAKFAGTTGYAWLLDNAYKFGFILSYPKDNSYYQFEPWHWRFVGVALATKLHDDNAHFYDLTQRDIDQYLISIFD